MVNFYVSRVKKGKKLWTEIRYLWQEDVKAKLIKEGYTLNDDGTVSKPDQAIQKYVDSKFALDARQANPNVYGTLAKQLSDLSGSFKMNIPLVVKYLDDAKIAMQPPKYFTDLKVRKCNCQTEWSEWRTI